MKKIRSQFQAIRDVKALPNFMSYVYDSTLFAILLESQSNPSYSPSPDVAHVLWMYLQ